MPAVPKPTKTTKSSKPKTPKSTKPTRPARDEFELEEIANQLTKSLEGKSEVILTVWKKGNIQGTVTKMDGNTKLIHVQERYGDKQFVKFVDILKVSYPNE